MTPSRRALVGIAIFNLALSAQTFRGAIAGTVIDASGGAVADCRVRAQNRGTGIQSETRTSRAGEFALPELALGRYSVTAECAGFATSEAADTTVVVSVATTLNITVRPEGQATSVLVEAPAENLETKSSARNIVVGSQLVSEYNLLESRP